MPLYCKRLIKPANILRRALEPMKGGCEARVNRSSEDEYEELATKLMTYAMSNGFDGCEDNKCLLIFIARYANYTSDAIDNLQNAVDKYALLSVIVESFCASYDEEPVREGARVQTIDVVRSLNDAVSLLLGNVSSKSDNCKPCAANYPAWISEVESIATDVVMNAIRRINASSWAGRQDLHELVAKDIVAKLNDSTYYFKALAYLPFTDDGQHGFLRLPVGAEDVLRNESKLVKYVVARYRQKANQSLAIVRKKWDAIKEKGNQILDDTFSTSASNLAKRVEEIESRFEKVVDGPFLSSDGSRALVALRYGYEFVWYELGYRYFPAGFATDNYVLTTKQSNQYTYNCGQIVFFP